MSKSLGNFFTVRDLLDKGFSEREIRYLLLSAHYRETFNFTLEGLHGARTALARIKECLGKLREISVVADAQIEVSTLFWKGLPQLSMMILTSQKHGV